jgi:hypothetical protein
MLALVPRGSHGKFETSVGQMVDGDGLSREDRRRSIGNARHQRAESHPGGDGGETCEERPCL